MAIPQTPQTFAPGSVKWPLTQYAPSTRGRWSGVTGGGSTATSSWPASTTDTNGAFGSGWRIGGATASGGEGIRIAGMAGTTTTGSPCSPIWCTAGGVTARQSGTTGAEPAWKASSRGGSDQTDSEGSISDSSGRLGSGTGGGAGQSGIGTSSAAAGSDADAADANGAAQSGMAKSGPAAASETLSSEPALSDG